MSDDYRRLAEAVVAARENKGWGQEDLIRASGLGRSTIQRLERGSGGTAPSRSTMQALERALGWTPGSVRTVLEGGKPELVEDRWRDESGGRYVRVQTEGDKEIIRDTVRRVLFKVAPNTPLSEVIEAEELALQFLTERGLLGTGAGTADAES